jgi:hypothetical protein
VKKSIVILFIASLLSIGVLLHLTRQSDDAMVPPPPPVPEFLNGLPQITDEKSAIGSREDPEARKAYELAIVADPATGQSPEDIKRREYLFASKLPKKNRGNALRNGSTNESAWRSIGPYNIGGRTRALAIDVTNENIILAGGVSGGMWRTENAGKDWEKTTVPANIHSVSCIVQDTRPGKTHIWYYGTGEFTANSASKKAAPFRGDGVFKSVDGGKNWAQLVSTSEGIPNYYNSQFQYVSKLLINKNNRAQDEVFLATVGAIFRSVDGGESWELSLGTKLQSTPDTDLNNSNISDYAEIAQALDSSFYAVLSENTRTSSSPNKGVYRSKDGKQWVQITPRNWPATYARTLIAPSTTNPKEIFFSVNAVDEELWKFTYLSGDGPQTKGVWENLSVNIPAYGGEVGDYDTQSSYNMVLEVHPNDGNIVFLGGTNLYRSKDGFSTDLNTAWIGGYDTANNIKIFQNHYVDQHALAFFPSNPNKMLSSNDGGVFITEDNTRELPTWRSLNNGFVTTQFYSVGLDEFGSYGDVTGGLQDNGSLIASKPLAPSTWNKLLSGDGGFTAITRNSSFYFVSFQFGKTYRFTLNQNKQTQTFTRVDPYGSGENDKLLFVNPFVLAPENQHAMYFAGGDVIWRNFNTSQIPLFKNEPARVNWEKMTGTELNDGTITALNVSYNPAGTVIYGTGDGRLFRINNANKAVHNVEDITASNFPPGGYVASIAFDKKDSEKVAVAFSNYNIISLYYSEDNGNSFENISGNLEENPDGTGSGPSVRWIEIVSKNNDESVLYAGTSAGLFSTNKLSGTNTIWEQEGDNIFGNVLVTMIRYFSKDGTMVIATHGNGMYSAMLDDVWHTELAIDGQDFSVGAPYPNPFYDQITIPFSIPEDGVVKACIYTAIGQNIKTILWANQYKGDNLISWDGTTDAGSKVLPGTYYCRIEYNTKSIGTRLVFMP